MLAEVGGASGGVPWALQVRQGSGTAGLVSSAPQPERPEAHATPSAPQVCEGPSLPRSPGVTRGRVAPVPRRLGLRFSVFGATRSSPRTRAEAGSTPGKRSLAHEPRRLGAPTGPGDGEGVGAEFLQQDLCWACAVAEAGRGLGRQDGEDGGSPGLYLLVLSGQRLTLIYNKVTLWLCMEAAPSSESKGG